MQQKLPVLHPGLVAFCFSIRLYRRKNLNKEYGSDEEIKVLFPCPYGE